MALLMGFSVFGVLGGGDEAVAEMEGIIRTTRAEKRQGMTWTSEGRPSDGPSSKLAVR